MCLGLHIQAGFVAEGPVCGLKTLSWTLKTLLMVIEKKTEWFITTMNSCRVPG